MQQLQTSSRSKLLQLLFFLIGVLVFGTIGYYVIEENWTLFESFYMTVITVTTVGYGETKELSVDGRIFTIILIFIGIGVVAVSATKIAKFIIEKEIKNLLGRDKMESQLKKLQEHYIVCGFGEIAYGICSKLVNENIPFVIIDDNPDKINKARLRNYIAVENDPTSDAILVAAGIEKANGIVACTGSDSDNLYITLAAREINREIHIIARGSDPMVEARMIRAGADSVVYPLKLGGEQIANIILKKLGRFSELNEINADPCVMGYHLEVYRHFADDSITIKEVKEKTSAIMAVSLKLFNLDTINNPTDNLEVTKEDSVVLIIDDFYKKEQRSGMMDTMKWTSDLSVGIPSIDKEHIHWIDLINKIEYSISEGNAKEKLPGILDEISEYTLTHLKHEDELFTKYDYPLLLEHKKIHENLVEKVKDLSSQRKYILPESISALLRSWVKHHISVEDKKYSKHLIDNGAV
jgi:voltage-gated potassium channel